MILTTHLKILNAKELFLRDQLGLVKEIIKATLIKFPFQVKPDKINSKSELHILYTS